MIDPDDMEIVHLLHHLSRATPREIAWRFRGDSKDRSELLKKESFVRARLERLRRQGLVKHEPGAGGRRWALDGTTVIVADTQVVMPDGTPVPLQRGDYVAQLSSGQALVVKPRRQT